MRHLRLKLAKWSHTTRSGNIEARMKLEKPHELILVVLIAHFEHINELETIWKIGTGFKLTLRAPEPHQPCHSILVFLSLDLNIFKVH